MDSMSLCWSVLSGLTGESYSHRDIWLPVEPTVTTALYDCTKPLRTCLPSVMCYMNDFCLPRG